MNTSEGSDLELLLVATELRSLDPDGLRTATVLRATIDQLYDGQRTGRYRWDQLFKTEKTHCGTLVEINLVREFKFMDGSLLDYQIVGIEVDCKYSQKVGSWMIPPEAVEHLCLVISAEDSGSPKWSMGLVRALPKNLNTGSNRDGKSTLNLVGKNSILWLFKDLALVPNVLLQLDPSIVEGIMALKSGQKRLNELFRVALGKRVGRGVIATVAQQNDYMKRIRGNGGARSALRPEGIIILGQYRAHSAIARALNLPVPGPGESISARIVPAKGSGLGIAKIAGQYWRIAQETDSVSMAPTLPEI